MNVLTYHIKQKELALAASWDELTARQFIALCKLLHSSIQDADLLYDQALHILSGKRLISYMLIHPHVRKLAQPFAAWVFEKQEVTAQLIPVYRGLYGPVSDFDNITMAEFHTSEAAFHALVVDQDEKALDELAAVLYRAPKKNYDRKKNIDGDVRCAFSWSSVQYYQRKTKGWPLAVKQAIVIWYSSCRAALMKSYPTAFGGDKIKQAGNYYEGLFKMIRGLSGDKYGTFDQVQAMPVHSAFLEIVTSLQEAEELKRKYPQLYE